jgi:DoxX-like family
MCVTDLRGGLADRRRRALFHTDVEDAMARMIAYWGSTALVAVMLLLSLSYLTGSEQVVSGFAKAGYPQHLRIVLGMVKPAAAVVLLVPGLALLKEWAYAGASFAWIMAFISAMASGEPVQVWILPPLLLLLLVVSYATRPLSRRLTAHIRPV